MSNVDSARVEFAFVTINHFFFVPVTIGLAFLTALLQTARYRSITEAAARCALTGEPVESLGRDGKLLVTRPRRSAGGDDHEPVCRIGCPWRMDGVPRKATPSA